MNVKVFKFIICVLLPFSVALLSGCEQMQDMGITHEIVSPSDETTMTTLKVGLTYVDVGDTFTLDISARNVIDLSGWEVDIAFDPTVLEAIEVNEGNIFGDKYTLSQKGTIDNATGKIIDFASVLIGEGVTGTGTLLSVTFRVKGGGETQIAVEKLYFANSNGEQINAEPDEVIFTTARHGDNQ